MKIKKLFTMVLLMASLVGCAGTGNTSSSSQTSDNGTSSTNPVTENAVKIKSINAKETEVETADVKARNRKNANSETTGTIDDINYIIIYKSQTDITFTITLDNPEAYAIDALRVTCDDENAQIQVDGEYKPIAQESDSTRVINWASEDPYTKTYNIRTTSEDAINSFKVVDVRLAGHDKFQSKETNSTDLGNNELHIYKMDEDAYTLNVIENTFEYIKFNFTVKDSYKDIISNIKVNGEELNTELGYWMLTESQTINVTYDYLLEEYGVKVGREDKVDVKTIEIQYVSYNYATEYYFYYIDEDGELIEYTHSLDKEYTIFNFQVNTTVDIEVSVNNEKLELTEIGFFQTPYDSFGYYVLYADFKMPEEVYTFGEFTQEHLGMTEEEYYEKYNKGNWESESEYFEWLDSHLENCEKYYSYIRENIIDIRITLGGVEFKVNLWGHVNDSGEEYWVIDGSTLGEYKSW